MKKYNFYFWTLVVSALLLSTLNSTSGVYAYYDNKTNFTDEEAIVIAQNHLEISEWLSQTNGFITIVELEYDYWHLIFESQINPLFSLAR